MKESVSPFLSTTLGEGVHDPALSPSVPTLPVLTLDAPADDDDAIEAVVERLPRERVVEALYMAMTRRRVFAQFEKMITSRIVADGILAEAEVWTAPDGIEFFWGGERHREVTDPAGLKAALESMSAEWGILAKRALKAAFKPQPDKVYLTELSKVEKFAMADDDVAHTIRDFTKWVEGSPKLRPVEEKRR